jgi:D-alanyl-D-alanine carboxypeptidase/D-alanyl-D-alanine-endopeptidase (penicillin-binding protein 4)
MTRFKHLILSTVLVFACYACGDPASEQTKAPVKVKEKKEVSYDRLLAAFDSLKSDKCMQGADLGYLVVDVTGKEPEVAAEFNQRRLLIPASTLKLFVTGAALEIFGKPVIPEITTINQMSVNWRSSKMLRKIGGKVNNKATTAGGAAAIRAFWNKKGLDTRGMVFDDGNGLSRNNAISVRNLVDLLYIMQSSHYFKPFYESLPLAGYSGTLRRAMKGTAGQGRVRAKTGTIAGVKSFAGYVHTRSGQKLIFALIVNNYNCRTKLIKKELEAVMIKMAEL